MYVNNITIHDIGELTANYSITNRNFPGNNYHAMVIPIILGLYEGSYPLITNLDERNYPSGVVEVTIGDLPPSIYRVIY